MARRSRSKDVCRSCGDVSLIDDGSFQPTGLCAAHSVATVRTAQKAVRAAYRAEAEVVVTVEAVDLSPCQGLPNGPYRYIATRMGEVVVNADGEPL